MLQRRHDCLLILLAAELGGRVDDVDIELHMTALLRKSTLASNSR